MILVTPFMVLLVGLMLALAVAGRPRREGNKSRWTIVFALLYLVTPPLLAQLAYWAAGQTAVHALDSADGEPSYIAMELGFTSIVLRATWAATVPIFALWWLVHAVRSRRSVSETFENEANRTDGMGDAQD